MNSTRQRWLSRAALLIALALGFGLACQHEDSGYGGEWVTLFDGTSLDGWQQAGPGGFTLEDDGSMLSFGGLGLFQYAERPFRDFILELEWREADPSDNSGVFVRFPEIGDDPWHAVNEGYEIQIDDTDAPVNVTGSIYSFQAPTKVASKPSGEWNHYCIMVTGQRYQIWLNGEKVNDFFGERGREGYIGLQNHHQGAQNAFRNIRVLPLAEDEVATPETLPELFAVDEGTEPVRVLVFTGAYDYRPESQDAAAESLRGLAETTEFDFTISDDIGQLTWENLEAYDLLFFLNTSGNLPLTQQQRDGVLRFMRAGKGFVGSYSAADTGHNWDTYREMLGGGLFEGEAHAGGFDIAVEEPEHPAVAHLSGGFSTREDSFSIRDELYAFDANPRWNSRVLLSLDTRSIGVEQGHPTAERNDYPVSWCRNFGGGRVFYTALGQNPEVWNQAHFVEHLLQGMRVAAGRVEADCTGERVKETIAENVWPVDIAVDEEGNVWIAELRGRIHRYDAATGETSQVADIPTTDPTNIEHGIFGVAVDPEFYQGEPYVYIYYAERETFINTLSRFEFSDGQLVMDTETVLLRVPTEPMCCHQAGDIEWGPDGTLYLSTGDRGMSSARPDWEISEERIEAFMERHDLDLLHWSRLVDSETTSQNLQDLQGKILRINRDGTIPKDNPFYGQPGVRWEIFAYGLRNPFRFTVDPETECLYIGMVGPDAEYDYAEFNRACEGGENFGWPRMVGEIFYTDWTPQNIPDFTPPLWEYSYETGSRAPMNGPVYRHSGEGAFPEAFQGKVFIYDWARRWIKWADVEDGRYVNIKTFDTTGSTQPISMQLGPDGALYLAEFTGFWDPAPGSKVSRYRWVSGNVAPVAAAAAEPWSGQPPLTVQFSSAESYDPTPTGTPLSYEWDFGDGATSSEPEPSHSYGEDGVYTATLTVTDSEGEMSEAAVVEVVVGNTVPSPEIVWPAPGAMTEPGRTLTLEGQAMDPEDGMLSGEALQWTVTAHYLEDGAERSEELAAFTGASGDVDIPEDLDWHGDVRYLVSLTATDSGGLSDSVENVVRYTRLQAQSYDVVSGFNPVSTSDEDGEQDLQARTAGDYFAWQGVNLTGRNPAFIRVAPGTTGGTLELRLGSNQGELLGTVEVAAGDEDAWETVAIPLEGAEGVHDLYLVAGAEGGAEDGGEVDLRVNWVQLVGPGVPRE